MAAGLSWAGACAVLGAVWTLAAAWQARAGRERLFLRGLAGGAAAAGAASGAYVLLGIAGAELDWGLVSASGWNGFGAALLIGSVEESAKLAGVGLALSSREPRHVARITVSVAAVFAVWEAFGAVQGWAWPVALGRAALAPVAHGALAIPFAWVVAQPRGPSSPRGRRSAPGWLRLLGALAIAASLHGLGDWSLAREGWGRLGFALAMAAPVVWLYVRLRASRSEPGERASVRTSTRSSSATPHACAMQPRGV